MRTFQSFAGRKGGGGRRQKNEDGRGAYAAQPAVPLVAADSARAQNLALEMFALPRSKRRAPIVKVSWMTLKTSSSTIHRLVKTTRSDEPPAPGWKQRWSIQRSSSDQLDTSKRWNAHIIASITTNIIGSAMSISPIVITSSASFRMVVSAPLVTSAISSRMSTWKMVMMSSPKAYTTSSSST